MSAMTDPLLYEDPVTRVSRAGADALATEWKTEVKPDGSIDWTFKLRKGVQFHQGWGEMKAADVKSVITEFQRPASRHPRAALIVKWYGGNPDNIEIVNDYEFIVHSPRIIVGLEEQVLNSGVSLSMRPFPKKYMEEVGEDGFSRHPIFTGPFEFAEHKRGQFLKFRAQEEHWRVVPEFAEVNLLLIPETSTQIALMQTGKGDMMDVAFKLKGEVEAAGLRLARLNRTNASEGWFGGIMLKSHPNYDASVPWVGEEPTDLEPTMVRQAMNLAIDRQAILDKILLGEGELTNTSGWTFPPGVAWRDPDWKSYPYDPKKAKELLAQAGYPEGFEFGVWLIRWPGRPYSFDVTEASASFWEAIGLRPNRVVAEYRPTVRQKLIDHKTGGWVYMLGNVASRTPWGHGCQVLGPSTSTIHHTEHPFIDSQCAKMEVELDFKKRAALAMEYGDWVHRNY